MMIKKDSENNNDNDEDINHTDINDFIASTIYNGVLPD